MRSRTWLTPALALLIGCGSITSFDGFSDRVSDVDALADIDASAGSDATTGAEGSTGADGSTDPDTTPNPKAPTDGGADVVVSCEGGTPLSTGYKTGAAAASAPGSDIAWTTPTDALTSGDGQYAKAVLTDSDDRSNALVVRSFGFAVPPSATIVGVSVEVSLMGGTMEDDKLALVRWDGSSTFPTYATGDRGGGSWPTQLGAKTYAAASSSWGTLGGSTLSPAIVNGSDFGVALGARYRGSGTSTASVDVIRASIEYCP